MGMCLGRPVLVVFAVVAMAGCREPQPGSAELRCSSPVTHLERVAEVPDAGSPVIPVPLSRGHYERVWLVDTARAWRVPGRAGVHGSLARGRDLWALIGGRPRWAEGDGGRSGTSDERGAPGTSEPAVHEIAWWEHWYPARRDAVWICDTNGRPIGRVEVDWPGRRQDVDAVEAAWDDSGQRLAVWASAGANACIGLADPHSLQFRGLHQINDLHSNGITSPRLFWANDSLICCYEAERDTPDPYNVVLRIDVVNGEADEALGEEQWDPSCGPLDTALVSHDGRHVAFDRSPLTGGTCLGLWLLNLESGEWSEITYEYGSRYRHRLVKWEAPNVIRFHRHFEPAESEGTDGQPWRETYRAHVAAPVFGAPSPAGEGGEITGEACGAAVPQHAGLDDSCAPGRPREALTATGESMSGEGVRAGGAPVS